MSAREPLGRITKEKLEELAAAELLHALKRRNSLNAEMKISQITAAGDCRFADTAKTSVFLLTFIEAGALFSF